MSVHEMPAALYASAKQHQWATMGVSDYPPRDPIVGQNRFFDTFKHFIHLVDSEAEQFAHVFAVIADWGKGKSRLGYELIAQINDRSPGWYTRTLGGAIQRSELFKDDADRDQYLGLYIRYSQIATEYQNSENWFAYGLYKALIPLATERFDGSIQARVAEDAYNRLLVQGFENQTLASALELEKNHSDEDLYDDPILATSLANAAYRYLVQFGIKYILIVLDELETAAEAATFGLEGDDLKRLDGRAIKLMGQAIKEEDPRRKLPWLRYVALCSPAIGEELREIQSTARRFELVDLEHNAFSDVSDFVRSLEQQGKLSNVYPTGLVEAAYAMSGGNFGWFNVIMANVDGYLRAQQSTGQRIDALGIGAIFSALVKSSSRIRDHVLDHKAIEAIKAKDRAVVNAARELLYGQLPVSLKNASAATRQLQQIVNEYDEPVAALYRKVSWDRLDCEQALRNAKFERNQERWKLNSVEADINLERLLANLRTYAIHEAAGNGSDTLLIPTSLNEFVQLVSLLYPHPAAEDVARALWRHFLGAEDKLQVEATHIGPSIAMLSRSNLRYRVHNQNSLIFRQPDQSSAHEQAMKARTGAAAERRRERLTGAIRVLDNNWNYDPVDAALGGESIALATPIAAGRGQTGGLINCDALKLHPKGRALFVWVSNRAELERAIDQVQLQFRDEGRTPVIAFTPSIALVDQFHKPNNDKLRAAQDYLLLYQLSSTEEDILERVGLKQADCRGFELKASAFTAKFISRLEALRRSLREAITRWRQALNRRGLIAWPLRASGRLNEQDRHLLIEAWHILGIKAEAATAVRYLDSNTGIDLGQLVDLLPKLAISPRARSQGYDEQERALLFSATDDSAEAVFPPFLSVLLRRTLKEKLSWTYDRACQDWFWGYTWDSAKPREIFNDWMTIACRIDFLENKPQAGHAKDREYTLLDSYGLKSKITEADNWLKGGGSNDYPAIVSTIQDIYGAGRMTELFGPSGTTPVGTMTNEALNNIQQAQTAHDAILQYEETELGKGTDLEAQSNILRNAAHNRYLLLKHIEHVYNADRFAQIAQVNFRTLNLDDDRQALWQRIGQARLFAAAVQDAHRAIRAQIDTLKQAIQSDPQAQLPFPRSLFTLSLDNIAHIIAGSIKPGSEAGETADKQMRDHGTLGHFLRKLEIDKATERLEALSREVGYDFHNKRRLAIEAIDGHIITSYRRLKSDFHEQQNRLAGIRARRDELAEILNNAPQDFHYPEQVPDLAKLERDTEFVQDAFESVVDDALALRNRFIQEARLGDFRGIAEHAPSLLKAIKNRIALLLGHLQSIENAIGAYRRSLLKRLKQSELEALNALLKIKGEAAYSALTLPDVQRWGALDKAVAAIEQRHRELHSRGDQLLANTGVTFSRWNAIVTALNNHQDPQLSDMEANQLVNHGFLVRTYRLGG